MTNLENLRLGTLADRQRRLNWASADTAKRAVELLAAVAADNTELVLITLERLERGAAAVRACLDDISAAPPDAEVVEYRAELMLAKTYDGCVPAVGAQLGCGDRRSGSDRRDRDDHFTAHANGYRRRPWPFGVRRSADREAAGLREGAA